jgi:Fe-S cluster assembly protein SufD
MNDSLETRPEDAFLAGHADFMASRASSESEAVLERRRRAIGRFADIGLPTRRHEDWRYTNIRPLAKAGLRPEPPADAIIVEPAALDRFTYWESSSARIVIVDGSFRPELSRLDDLPEGLEIMPLEQALAEKPDEVLPHLGAQLDEEDRPFALLNSAWLSSGVLVRVAPGLKIDGPLHLLYLTSGDAPASTASVRNLVIGGRSSEFNLVERYAGLHAGEDFLTNAVTEIRLEENASLRHVKIQREAPSTTHIASIGVVQERSSRFRSVQIGVGGALGRTETIVKLAGSGAETKLTGLGIARGRQQLDAIVRVEHVADHASSEQLFKNIVSDEATCVFDGVICVPKDVLGTEAHQTNANLLLTEKANAITRPQLEIDADDVACSHGATVGAIDHKQLFYLRSRGIPESVAREMLTAAFADDVAAAIGIESIEARLREYLVREMRWEKLDFGGPVS